MLRIDPFYTDETLTAYYEGLTLPDGRQADATMKVRLAFKRPSTCSEFFVISSPVVVEASVVMVTVAGNEIATATMILPPNSLHPGLYEWRTSLVDSAGNLLPLDKDEVKVEVF